MASKEILRWKLDCNEARELVIRAGHKAGAGHVVNKSVKPKVNLVKEG